MAVANTPIYRQPFGSVLGFYRDQLARLGGHGALEMSKISDPPHWYRRAEQARRLADELTATTSGRADALKIYGNRAVIKRLGKRPIASELRP